MQKEKEQLFEQINEKFDKFTVAHQNGTKKSSKEARKALGEIKKLVTSYRKASVQADK